MSLHGSDPLTTAEARDELLEALWTAEEDSDVLSAEALLARIDEQDPGEVRTGFDLLESEGLISAGAAGICLTAAGKPAARAIVRRHRLAETLLAKVLALPLADADRTACRLEHVLDDGATDAVCAFLGHPTACPHGREIPTGACCATLARPHLQRLLDLPSGASGTIVLIAPDRDGTLARLSDLGIFPGARLTVRQRVPSLVVAVDQTVLALDDDTAGRILVGAPD